MARTPARRGSTGTPSITSAGRSHQQDVNSRMVRYAVAMAVRTAYFALLFVVPWPWKWLVAVGAVVLPYVAVLIANAGRERLPVAWGAGRQASDVGSPFQPQDDAGETQQAVMPVQVVQGETVRAGTVPPVPGDDELPGRGHAA